MFSLIKKFFAPKKASERLPENAFARYLGDGDFKAYLAAPLPPDSPPRDLRKLCGELLSALPQCTAKVLIAGPSYGDKHYKGDVIADTSRLLPWAEYHGGRVISSDDREQAAREILPTWLKGADLSNPTPALPTEPFRSNLRRYADHFITKNIAEVFCYECRRLVAEVSVDYINPRNDGGFHWRTTEWHCSEGHLLHQEDHGARIIRRRKESGPVVVKEDS